MKLSDVFSNQLDEAIYDGMVGFMEMVAFMNKATETQKTKLKSLLGNKKFREAWELVSTVTGITIPVDSLVSNDLKEDHGETLLAPIAVFFANATEEEFKEFERLSISGKSKDIKQMIDYVIRKQ